MKKNDDCHLFMPSFGLTKFLRIMKLTSLFLFVLCINAFSEGNSQTTVTLNLKQVDLNTVFSAIEKNTQYSFFYNDNLLPKGKKFSISAKDESVISVLDRLFANLPITYKLSGANQILIGSSDVVIEAIPVSGTVKAADGTPLSGVSIKIKGSSAGTTTNSSGFFTIDIPADAIIIISSVGYLTQEIQVAGKTTFSIVLLQANKELDDVVVIGYGTQKRRNITSAISTVSSKELTEIKAPGLDQALQGRSAGVQVTKNTGAPGGGVSIRIRGVASINGGQEPLYIVDGVPINNTPTGTSNVFNTSGIGFAGNETVNPISQIPIDDIESIEILKDAASASIYGARASNGVVLITTKKAKAGKIDIALNAYYGVSVFPSEKKYDLLSGPEFATAVNTVRRLKNLPILYLDSANVSNTNWQDEIFQVAPTAEINLSINGAGEKVKYGLSVGYFNQEGVLLETYFKRYNARTFLEFSPSSKFKVIASTIMSYSDMNRMRNFNAGNGTFSFNGNNLYGPSVLSAALITNPAFKPYSSDGLYNVDTLGGGISPVASAKEIDILSKDFRAISSLTLEYKLFKQLTLHARLGADFRTSQENQISRFVPGVFNGAATGASVEYGNYNELIWLTENYATYDFKINNDHELEALVGFSAQESKNNGISIRYRNMPANDVTAYSLAGQFLNAREQGLQFWGINSFFSRINYSFKSKYLLTGVIRRDGSSRFGPDKKYGIFPSASAGWILSEEKFLQNVKPLNFLKLRASYGITGNDQIDPYRWRTAMGGISGSTGAYLGIPTVGPTSIQIGDYSWEQTSQFDIGVDATLLKNRLNIVVDYYVRTTNGLLYSVPTPSTTGFTSIFNNIGRMENKGWEFSFNSKNIQNKNFRWATDFNITFNKNKLLSLYEGRTEDKSFGNTMLKVGEPISWRGLIIDGINPANGDFLPRNQAGTSPLINDSDVVRLGSPLPKHFGGFNNRFTYKNFDLSVFFTWSFGNMIYNTTRSYVENVQTPTGGNGVITNMSRDAYFGRWQKPGDIAEYRGFDVTNTFNAVAGQPHNFYLEDGSFLRCKAITLSYTLTESALKFLKIKSVRLYGTTNNLFTFTNYSGYDPEVNASNTGTNIRVGYDVGTYPQSRTYVMGVNVNF